MKATVTTIAGVGSLVSESSARRSFEFVNFRLGIVKGWRRAFNQANWVNLEHGFGSTYEDSAAIAMIPTNDDPPYESIVALMDVIGEDDLRSFYERETGYDIAKVDYWSAPARDDESGDDGLKTGEVRQPTGTALLCTACLDDEQANALWTKGSAMEKYCSGSNYSDHWMQMSLRPLWPDPSRTPPLSPAPGYLELCAEAHRQAGILDHFLDSTVLNDRKTTLRRWTIQKVLELVDRGSQKSGAAIN